MWSPLLQPPLLCGSATFNCESKFYPLTPMFGLGGMALGDKSPIALARLYNTCRPRPLRGLSRQRYCPEAEVAHYSRYPIDPYCGRSAKGMMEEADKEKALKQVAEASLNEKTLELNVVERRATTAERARELAEQKAEDLQRKLGEAEVKLVKVSSIVFTHDKELANLK